jgi:hypothetical protein
MFVGFIALVASFRAKARPREPACNIVFDDLLSAVVITRFADATEAFGSKYRGSFNMLAFGEIKPYIGSLKGGRLDLVYYRDPGLSEGSPFPLWTLH